MASLPLPYLLQTLRAQGAAPSHLDRITMLRELCERAPGCVGLALVGSFAKGRGDRISDLDLAAFFVDGSAQGFLEQADVSLREQPSFHVFSGTRGADGAFRKYVFLDFSSCELYALDLPTDFRLRRPYIAVWDPLGQLKALEVDEAPPRHEDFEAYQHGDDGLLWELFDCVKWLQRGQADLAKHHLRKLARALPPSAAALSASPEHTAELRSVNTKILAEGESLPTVALKDGSQVQTGTVATMLMNIRLYNEGARGQVERELELALPTLFKVGLFDLFAPDDWIATASNPGRALVGRLAKAYLENGPA